MSAARRLELKLKIFIETKSEEGTSRVKSNNRPGVKLLKFEIKKFSGNPLEWEIFKETFETAIKHNKSLTRIEKFICDGFPLTNENYHNAWNLLQERYGNSQLITSAI